MKKIIIYFAINLVFIFQLFSQELIQPVFVDSVVMRDGRKLAVDVYLPDTSGGAAYPVILVQTPYNRLHYRTIGLPLFGASISTAHYGMVIADWRCFYGSSGACAGNYDRGKDGYDLVEWIAAQSWCDGKVGTWGLSALRQIQFMTARKRPPHLICCVPLVSGPQTNYTEYYPGGDYRTEYLQQLDALGFGMSPIVLAHQVYDLSWAYSELVTNYPDSVNVPMLMIGGWYDHNINVMMDFFSEIRQSSYANVRDKHRLLMGPWTHGGINNSGQEGELYYPNAVGWADSLALMHFDHYLRSIPNSWGNSPYIQYYQMGENTWQNAASWPPAGVSNHTLYFYEDGSIMQDIPQNAGIFKQFVYDPHDPSPTIGGCTLRTDLEQGPYNQALLVESRSDVLTFTSNTLISNVVMKGKCSIHLFVSSDRKDTDFSVRLTDVYPDNRSMLLSDGIARMRFRDGYTAADTSCMIPGQVYEIVIDLPDVAITFLAWHRIRVDVSSSDYPRFDSNLNNGGPMYTAGDTLTATNNVFVSSDHASYIQMPINGFYVGISETSLNKPEISIYPNPAGDFIGLEFSVRPKIGFVVKIVDLNGKMVFVRDFCPDDLNADCLNIPLSGLAKGVYHLVVSDQNFSSMKEIIIMK